MILSIETATTVCSAALINEKGVVSFREINEGFRHAEKLTVFIEEILSEAGIKPSDLDAIAISNGPGSYTGLRIGMSVAKGLCYSLDKPLISISTLEIMVVRAIAEIKDADKFDLFLPMIDARRMEVYCALYDRKLNSISNPSAQIITEELFISETKGKSICYFGDGAEKCSEVLKDNFVYHPDIFPSAKFMSTLAMEMFDKKQFENSSLAEPFYLKEFVAGKKSF